MPEFHQQKTKRLVFIALFFTLQSLYVFAVLITTFAYADYFPRIISTIFFWFLMPMLGIPIIGFIGKKLLTLMKIFIDEDAYFIPYALTAVTLWVPLLIGINIGIDEYFSLSVRGAAIAESVQETSQFAEKGYIEVQNSGVKNGLFGMHAETTTIKTGDKVTRSVMTYFCAPVYEKGKATSNPVALWLCDTSDAVSRQDFNPTTIKGRIIHNRYDINFYSLAVEDAKKRHLITTAANPIFLAFSSNSYEELLALKELHATIFGVSVFFIWILFSTVIVARMIPVESSSTVPGELPI